jgi:hypothetical protein
MDSKLSDIKTPLFIRKQLVPINVMSNILSFIDNEYKMNLMKMVRLIIDFGWYPHAKQLLEKYYSELPIHKKVLEYGINDITATGPYLLQMMGYYNKFDEKHTYNSFVYFSDMKKKYVEQSYGINRSDDNDCINRYEVEDDTINMYRFYEVNLYDTDLNKAVKLNNIFDLCNNTLRKSNNKFKFTFAKPIPTMLKKHINMKLDEDTLHNMGLTDNEYQTENEIENMDIYRSKIAMYIKNGFSFDF